MDVNTEEPRSNLHRILDHGFIEVITYMGDDLMVVNTARVSYHKVSDWEYDKRQKAEQISNGFGGMTNSWSEVKSNPHLKDADRKLIHYLANHNHWSPFAHPKIHLRIKMPIFVARQWFKHQIGFDRNEVSRRYVDEEPVFYIPTEWRGRPVKGQSKQGSSGLVAGQGNAIAAYDKSLAEAKGQYNYMVNVMNVAPEQARIVLPQSTYTEFIETGSLYGYARLHGLRASEDAQWEIRQYAKVIDTIMSGLFPISWVALTQVKDLHLSDTIDTSVIKDKSGVDIISVTMTDQEKAIADIESIISRIRNKTYTEPARYDY